MNHYLKQSLDRRNAAEISQISFSSEFQKLVLQSVISPYKEMQLNGCRHLCSSLELEGLIRFILFTKCALFCFLSFCFHECVWPIQEFGFFLRKAFPTVLEFRMPHIQENNSDITQPIEYINTASQLSEARKFEYLSLSRIRECNWILVK